MSDDEIERWIEGAIEADPQPQINEYATRSDVRGAVVEDTGMAGTDATEVAGEAEADAEPLAATSRIGDRRAG
jgi:hypothetical protein